MKEQQVFARMSTKGDLDKDQKVNVIEVSTKGQFNDTLSLPPNQKNMHKGAPRRSLSSAIPNLNLIQIKSEGDCPDYDQEAKVWTPRREHTARKLIHKRSSELTSSSKKVTDLGKILTSVDYLWGFLVCLSDIFSYIIALFYLGIAGFPTRFVAMLRVFTEFILLVDAFIVTYIFFCENKHLKTLSINRLGSWTSNAIIGLILVWIASYPLFTINEISKFSAEIMEGWAFAVLGLLKIIRYPEVSNYLDYCLRNVKAVYAILIQSFKNALTIFMLIHTMVTACLTLVRLEKGHDWVNRRGLSHGSSTEIYFQFFLLVTSNMGGTCYGDSQPVTDIEMVLYCIVVFVGATVLASVIGNLASSVYLSNKNRIDNQNKIELIKNFTVTRGLSNELGQQLISYYETFNLEFSRYLEHCEVLLQLPSSLRSELVFKQNLSLIQRVKIFQLSDPSFILPLLLKMKPTICMAGDYITQEGEIADSFYIINKGVARVVCADDETITISYLTEGCYFGEIGVLLNGKRSASVIAQSNCMLFIISKEALMKVLKDFDKHKEFIEAVGRQRLKTTQKRDLLMQGNIINASAISPVVSNGSLTSLGNSSTKGSSNIWNNVLAIVVLLSIMWNLYSTVFLICFEVSITDATWAVVVDVLALLVYAIDLALNPNSKYFVYLN